MTLTIEEIRKRIEDALELGHVDYWLDEAVRRLDAYRNQVNRRRIYDISSVGNRLRTAREVVGLTQTQLSSRLGVHNWSVSHWENGRADMPAKHLPGLCVILCVSREWLLMLSDEGGPPVPREVLRKQHLPNYPHMSRREKDKIRQRAELERLRGLRPPKEAINR